MRYGCICSFALNCKVSPGEQDVLLRMDPERFFVPAYLGAKGWIGVRIDLDAIDWDDITQLITDSYRLIAPRRLAALTPAFGHPSPTRGEG